MKTKKCFDCDKPLIGEGESDEQILSGICDDCWKKSINEENGLDELDEDELEELYEDDEIL